MSADLIEAPVDLGVMPDKESFVLSIDSPIEEIEINLLALSKQANYEMRHSFSPGIYMREILMFAGTTLIGAEHTGEHFNVVLKGRCFVSIDGVSKEIVAPSYFRSGVGVRKVLHIIEDTTWITVHPNPDDEHDIEKLEARIMKHSAVYRKFKELIKTAEFREHGAQFKPSKVEVNP